MVFNQASRANNLLKNTKRLPPDQLQFLDWGDFQRYILALVGQDGHLTNDVDYLSTFHQQLLTKHKSDSKKESGCVQTLGLSDDLLTTLLASNTE